MDIRICKVLWLSLGAVVLTVGVCSPAPAQQPFGGMQGFLARLDRNGNGSLDPGEISLQMRGFLERIAQADRSIDLSRPIPLDRLAQAFERARQARFGSSGGYDRDRDRDDDDDDDDDRRRWRRDDDDDLEVPDPLVPGFGPPEDAPVPGFGEAALLLTQVTEEDLRDADRAFSRYDRNNDGFLDREEMQRGRWRGQPYEYDRNRDGRISRDEMALRYADRRRDEEEEDRREREERESRSRSSSGSSSRDDDRDGIDPRMEGIANSIMGRYDKNRNGVLDRDEWGDMRTDPSAGDKNRDGRITREELAAWFSERMRSRGWGRSRDDNNNDDDDDNDRRSRFGRDDDRSEQDDDERVESDGLRTLDTRTYRFGSVLDRLNERYEDLPDWFARSDADGDGQIAMSEYAQEWPQSKVKEFLALDRNGDGVATPRECMAAVEEGFEPGRESASDAPMGGTRKSELGSRAAYDEESPSGDSSPSPIDARYLRYAAGLVKQYDANDDGSLDRDEAANVNFIRPETDADNNGQITPEELAEALSK